MDSGYDMCIDYETLCEIEQKLINVKENLSVSADSMLYALRNCEGFLSGNQFEKACKTTIVCTDVSKKTVENITELLNYISRLKQCLESYSNCRYSE